MFRLADQGKVWWPVVLTQATGPEPAEEVQVWLQLRIFDRKELREREKASLERMADRVKTHGEGALTSEHLLEALEAMTETDDADEEELIGRVCDWRGFGSGEAEEPFTADKLRALVKTRPLYLAFREALFAASREAPAKNSTPGPAGMSARVQA